MPKLPGINHKRAVKAFEKSGFYVARKRKHITMTNGVRIITVVIILGGGTKKRQNQDIDAAKIHWQDYKARKRQNE